MKLISEVSVVSGLLGFILYEVSLSLSPPQIRPSEIYNLGAQSNVKVWILGYSIVTYISYAHEAHIPPHIRTVSIFEDMVLNR